jgi:hypothetical protein
MKKSSLLSLKLKKSTVSNLNSSALKPSLQGKVKGGGWSDYPCIDNLGEPSFHCGSLSCESFGCPTEDWTVGRCEMILG